jgi:hypothetical protein
VGGLRDNNPKRDNVASALTMVLSISLLDLIATKGTTIRHSAQRDELRLYRDRNSFPSGILKAYTRHSKPAAPQHGRSC